MSFSFENLKISNETGFQSKQFKQSILEFSNNSQRIRNRNTPS